MIATFVRNLPGFNGDAHLYSLDEPIEGTSYIAVAVVNWPRWHLVETQMVPCSERGAAITSVDGSLGVVIKLPPTGTPPVPPTHAEALATLGYTIAEEGE